MSPEKLIYMANQIARAFAHQSPAAAAAATAGHIRSFWDPRMRAEILACLDSETAFNMLPVVREALTSLKAHEAACTATALRKP